MRFEGAPGLVIAMHRESRELTQLATTPVFFTRDLKAVPEKYRTLIPEYIKDYVTLNQFVA